MYYNTLELLIHRLQTIEQEPVAVAEPIIETGNTKLHPLVQAMQELKEEGVISPVTPDITSANKDW
jgi:hypothetical protein